MRLSIQKLAPVIEYAAFFRLGKYISHLPEIGSLHLLLEVVITPGHPNHGIESRECAPSVG